jgi:threonine dehydrogenase-like Zn-dependent dehydrogenase
MQQLTYTGPQSLEWREAPEPKLSSDRAALVRPRTVATCDLDQLIIQGSSPFSPPLAIGHECVAEVLEVGDGVSTLQPGELVSVPFQISCGECSACRRGRTSNCTEVAFMSTYGFGPAVERWGGFLSDTVCVPYAEHMLVKLPAGLDPATVASAYVDESADRRATAQAVGAETLAEIPKRLGPFPITVDASADPEGLALALRSTAPDGICTSCAIYFGEQPTMPLLEMYTKGITFKTGRANARPAIPHVLALAATDELHLQRVTTRVVGWGEAADALLEGDWTKLVIER